MWETLTMGSFAKNANKEETYRRATPAHGDYPTSTQHVLVNACHEPLQFQVTRSYVFMKGIYTQHTRGYRFNYPQG
jgi:hypothetical protein